MQELQREEMMNDPARLEQARLTLGSLSAFNISSNQLPGGRTVKTIAEVTSSRAGSILVPC